LASDAITLLKCRPGKRACKRFRGDGKIEDYDLGWDFAVDVVPLEGVEDLYNLLTWLTDQPDLFVIRGAPDPGLVESDVEWVPRRSKDDGDVFVGGPPFIEASHHWAALDADEFPHATLDEFREALPEELRGGSVWQWSAKAHVSPNVRGRLWTWTDEPMTDAEWRPLAKGWGFDPSIFRCVQPIYTAAPGFPDGVPDPIAERIVWL
jgi:hypothetical protein